MQEDQAEDYERAVRLALEKKSPQILDEILRAPQYNKKGEVTGYHSYLFNRSMILGKGAYGAVYKAFPIDPKTGKPNHANPVAVKIYKDPREFKEIETTLFRKYYKGEAPFRVGNKIYFVMELLPGFDLFDSGEKLNKEFQNLSLGTTLEIIYKLCVFVNLFHHDTFRTGSALSHGDLKGSNIKVEIKENGTVNVYPFDFGLSDQIVDDPNAVIVTPIGKGTPLYSPFETDQNNQRGVKSDIYALTPIILTLLGATTVFADKYAAHSRGADFVDILKTKYNFTDLTKRFTADFDLIHYKLRTLLFSFLDRMQADNYLDRPDSDQVLQFFTSLNNCYKINQEILLKSIEQKNAKSFTKHMEIRNYIRGLNESLQNNYGTMILLHHNLWEPKKVPIFLRHNSFVRRVIELHTLHELDNAKLLQACQCNDISEAKVEKDKKRLINLKKNGFSSAVIQQLEIICEKDPDDITTILDALEKFDKPKIDQLNLLIKYCNDYYIRLDCQILAGVVCGPELDVSLIAKLCTEAFIMKTKIEANPREWMYTMLYYDSKAIIEAAKKLLNKIANSAGEFTVADEKILLTTPLAAMIKELKLLERQALACAKIPGKVIGS